MLNSDRQRRQTSPAPSTNEGQLYGKIAPNAVPVENELIGQLLLEQTLGDVVFGIVQPDQFYLEKNQLVVRTIWKLYQGGRAIDAVIVWQQIVQDQQEKNFPDGPVEILRYTNATAYASEQRATDFARIVFQTWLGRRLIQIAGETIGAAYTDDAFDVLEKTERAFLDIAINRAGGKIQTGSELAFLAAKKIAENRLRDTYLTGITTGIEQLDKVIRGWQPGDFNVLAARPSGGKTALALHFIRAACEAGEAVGFFSIEMKSEALAMRMLAAIAEVNLYRLQIGRIDDVQEKMINEDAGPKLAKMKVFIDDTPNLSLFELRSKARLLVRREKVKLILLDYLQIMTPEDTRAPREQQVANLSRGVKALARELNVSFVVLAQLGRGAEAAKKPKLSDIRESDAIGQGADVALLLWGADDDDAEKDLSLKEARFLKVAKQRDGERPTIHLRFQGEIQKFSADSGAKKPKDPSRGPTWSPLPAESGGNLFTGKPGD